MLASGSFRPRFGRWVSHQARFRFASGLLQAFFGSLRLVSGSLQARFGPAFIRWGSLRLASGSL
jgi:hypothetical protein